jgi:hypothetical protein
MAHKLNAEEPHVTPLLCTSFWLLIWPFYSFQKVVKHVASSLLFSHVMLSQAELKVSRDQPQD